MAKPHIKVLGVYRLEVTRKLVQEQFNELYGYEMSDAQRRRARRDCKAQLESVALIEALVENRDDGFRVGDFTQEQKGVPRDSWQAAWAEVYLTTNGKSVLPTRTMEPPDDKSFRIAFYLHCYQPDKPLVTSYGDVTCPADVEMPPRLKRLAPFVPVD